MTNMRIQIGYTPVRAKLAIYNYELCVRIMHLGSARNCYKTSKICSDNNTFSEN